MLYVDESNRPAMALYDRLGFARWTAHINYHSADADRDGAAITRIIAKAIPWRVHANGQLALS